MNKLTQEQAKWLIEQVKNNPHIAELMDTFLIYDETAKIINQCTESEKDLTNEDFIKDMGQMLAKPVILLSAEFLSRIDMIECRLSKLEWALSNKIVSVEDE